MKLFTKISLIAAVIAATLGIAAVCIGLAMGADLEELENMGVYLSPHQQIGITVLGDFDDEHMEELIEDRIEEKFQEKSEDNIISNNGHHGIGNVHRDRHHNEDLHCYRSSIKGIEKLEVEVKSAQITIFATEDSEEIIYYSNRENDISQTKDFTFKIEDERSLTSQLELEIYVPTGIFKEIEIEAEAGLLAADKMIADNIAIEMDGASVQVDSLIVTEKAKLQINAGEMVIGYFDGKILETECDMGSIMVVCDGSNRDYNYNLECGMGNIQVGEESYSGVGGEIRINNGGEKSIKAECDMGEIRLEFPNNL